MSLRVIARRSVQSLVVAEHTSQLPSFALLRTRIIQNQPKPSFGPQRQKRLLSESKAEVSKNASNAEAAEVWKTAEAGTEAIGNITGVSVKSEVPADVVSKSLSSRSLLQGQVMTANLGEIARYGPGDSCVTLNVGGKSFYTLRSTVNSNPVLADHVARAEANKNVMQSGAVFIDRDPAHFDFILQYLRNKGERLTYGELDPMSWKKFTKMHVQLPTDERVLSDLFVEATYYRIPELQDALCNRNYLTTIMGFFASGNPIVAAAALMKKLRTFMLAFGGLAGSFAITMQKEVQELLEELGWKTKEEDEEEPGLFEWTMEAMGVWKKKSKHEEPPPPAFVP